MFSASTSCLNYYQTIGSCRQKQIGFGEILRKLDPTEYTRSFEFNPTFEKNYKADIFDFYLKGAATDASALPP